MRRPYYAFGVFPSVRPAALLADTEAGEDVTEQVIAAELTANLAQLLLAGAQIFSEQLSGAAAFHLSSAVEKDLASPAQGFKVAAASAELPRFNRLVTCALLEMLPQQVETLPGFRREGNAV